MSQLPHLSTSSDWPEGAIPLAWVESLFKRMAAAYGALLADQWRGQDTGTVKRLWAIELGKVTVEELTHGVQQLGTRKWPPTLPEFVLMCKPPMVTGLPSHTMVTHEQPSKARTPADRARELLGGLKHGGIKSAEAVAGDGKEWARRIAARRERGEVMYLAQLESAEKVLGTP